MHIFKYDKKRYSIAFNPRDEALFQCEVDSKPFFNVNDIASLIEHTLRAELKVYQERYEK